MNIQSEEERITELAKTLMRLQEPKECPIKTPIPNVYLKEFGEDSGGSRELNN